MSLVVRPRRPADVLEVVSWIASAKVLYSFSGARLQWPLTSIQLENLTHTEGLSPFVVVGSADRLVGHFDLRVDERVAWLGRVAVKPEFQGRGLAIEVVNAALVQAQELGADAVRLRVIATNEPAIRTYLRAGFATGLPDPERPSVLLMERSLLR
ncbi:GNAT family N-acetyltransferase [Microcella humidisoli]|uniref:GNAT family N-acetyltransferase n=1 Tax=Microcella humidisoli TaxID=2963406 RepID=UPI0020CB7743|nr:GNAT family N-acetyltransferase [Microcella humidisoli]